MNKGSTRRVRLNAWLGVTPQDGASRGIAGSELRFTVDMAEKKASPKSGCKLAVF
jgi:hypothetical protein